MLPTIAELKARHISRGELAAELYPETTFDLALPQPWVNRHAAAFSEAVRIPCPGGETVGADLPCGFVWIYPQGSIFGEPAPLFKEAGDWLQMHLNALHTYA